MLTPIEARRVCRLATEQAYERDSLIGRAIYLHEVIAERRRMAAANADNAYYVEACVQSIVKWELQLLMIVNELAALPTVGPALV